MHGRRDQRSIDELCGSRRISAFSLQIENDLKAISKLFGASLTSCSSDSSGYSLMTTFWLPDSGQFREPAVSSNSSIEWFYSSDCTRLILPIQ